jgi:pilus assembly protein Flp/PilA
MNGFIKLYAVISSFEATITDRRDAKGITAIEYALLAAGIAAAVGLAAVALGGKITTEFGGIL